MGIHPLAVEQCTAVFCNCAGSLPWELLYADDLVVIADSKEQMIRKLRSEG